MARTLLASYVMHICLWGAFAHWQLGESEFAGNATIFALWALSVIGGMLWFSAPAKHDGLGSTEVGFFFASWFILTFLMAGLGHFVLAAAMVNAGFANLAYRAAMKREND